MSVGAEVVAVAHEGLARVGTFYRVERWKHLRAEMLPLLVRHWREIALNHADVPLDIDEGQVRRTR